MLSPNTRIVVNFIASYGRSLYTIAIGLLCGRWTLMALGQVDYGLMGLIGGLASFISIFNSLMATAIGRYFAYSVGAAEGKGESGLEECRRWFNIALLIHTVVPVIALLIGYPLGEWAIICYLNIPSDRVVDCLWVWRFVCIGSFLGMVAVPFNAMYTAKQYIAELTVYTFVTVTMNAFFLYYMVSHPGDWLVYLAAWSCFLAIAPQVVVAIRAVWIFPECKIKISYMWNLACIKEILVFAFYRFFGALGWLVRDQGVAILVNKLLGPSRNSALSVAGAVAEHTKSLSNSFLAALSPAITNAYGAGDLSRVGKLSSVACRLSTVMVLVFALPLTLEAKEVFSLWLKNPPDGCMAICIGYLVVMVMQNIVCGHYIAIFANGDIKSYQTSCLIANILTVPIAWVFLRRGIGLVAIALALVVSEAGILLIRLYFGRLICGISLRKWVRYTALPILVSSVISLGCGLIVTRCMHESFLRICVTTLIVNAAFLPLTWFLIFGEEEQCLVKEKVLARLPIRRFG